MKQPRLIIFYVVAGVGVLLTILMASLSISDRIPSPDSESLALMQKFHDVTLKYSEVPRRYRARGETYTEDEDSVRSQKQIWRAKMFDPTSFISEKTAVFSDTQSATESVESTMEEYPWIQFEVETNEKEGWPFHADNISHGCSSPTRYRYPYREASAFLCVRIGQYGNATMQLTAQIFGDPLLTMEEYEELFKMLDERMGKTFP